MNKLSLPLRSLKRACRPTVLVLLLMGLILVTAVARFWPFGSNGGAPAVPLPVPEGDQEIAWLSNATSTVAWERFVAAVRRVQQDVPDLGLKVADDSNAFPSQTTATPELAVTIGADRARLWFRWYKLTGATGPPEWVQALCRRKTPPLAIIGGNTSDRARDLAHELNSLRAQLASPPLLLITTATADLVDRDQGGQDLMKIYPDRSFRFCFTDRQMAEAVTEFIWQQKALRPDQDPVYSAQWDDDPYSEDLFERFQEVLGPDRFGGRLRQERRVNMMARGWAWLHGYLAGGGPPVLDLESLHLPPAPFWSWRIPYSEGTVLQPNRWEAEAAERMIIERGQHLTQQRPLLVLPANPRPAYRFLRALMRNSPAEASRFVVATGDAIDFDTVYRDRDLKWPIQDLPFPLVLFCHRNPVYRAAFQPDRESHGMRPEFLALLAGTPQAAVPANLSWAGLYVNWQNHLPDPNAVPDPAGRTSTGTQDLMLYRNIVETMARAAHPAGRLLGSADAVRQNLVETQRKNGRKRFDEEGNQVAGGGEYVVCLLPGHSGPRVLPSARLQVWHRGGEADQPRRWERVPIDGMPELIVDYMPRN